MEKVLELVFKNAAGDKKILSIADPKDGVTAEEANTAMTAVIEADVFDTAGGALTEIVEARVRSTQVDVLA